MFKYGVEIIREYAKETRNLLCEKWGNDEIPYISVEEKESVIQAMQFISCLETEGGGLFLVVPKRVQEMVEKSSIVLKEMYERTNDEVFLSASRLLKLANLKIGFEEQEKIFISPRLAFPTKELALEMEECMDYAPTRDDFGIKENYFGNSSIPKRKANKWGK